MLKGRQYPETYELLTLSVNKQELIRRWDSERELFSTISHT